MIELKVKAVSPLMGTKFPLPAYATAGAAAMDLCACVDAPVEVEPQTLTAPERADFTAVEWGGAEVVQ